MTIHKLSTFPSHGNAAGERGARFGRSPGETGQPGQTETAGPRADGSLRVGKTGFLSRQILSNGEVYGEDRCTVFQLKHRRKRAVNQFKVLRFALVQDNLVVT